MKAVFSFNDLVINIHFLYACNYAVPCNPDKKLQWDAIRKSWSLFQNSHEKLRAAPPGEGLTLTSYPVCNKTSLFRKSCMAAKTLLYMDHYHEEMVAHSKSVITNRVNRPLAEKSQ